MKRINRNTAAGAILAWLSVQPSGVYRTPSQIEKGSGAPASSVSPRLADLTKAGILTTSAINGQLVYHIASPIAFTLFDGPVRAPRIPGGKKAYGRTAKISLSEVQPTAAPDLADEVAHAIDEGKTPAAFAPPKLVVSKFQLAIERFAQDLAQFVVDEVEYEVVQRLTLLIPRIEQGVERRLHTTAIAPAKRRLPKVVVVGLLPQQAGILATEFQDMADLTFWKDESPHKLKDMAKSADQILVHTGHVSHQTIKMIESCGREPQLVNGGLSQLRDRLLSLL